jgi:HEAT repeat
MLDSNIMETLITKLGDEDYDVRQSVVMALSELAKHGEQSDQRDEQTLMWNKTIPVAVC